MSLSGRIAKINKAIEAGELGVLSPVLQERLESQILWLAKQANISDEIAVNQPISRDRLDIVVSNSRWQRWTKTTAGNAIYSPTMDTIFIDQALIYPTEAAYLGQNSNIVMLAGNELDPAASYVNFVLAHELGHREDPQAKGGHAFFYYGALEGSGDQGVEVAADRFAVNLLIRALSSENVPDFIHEANALGVVGVDSDATGADLAAAEIIGAVTLMSKLLLFSTSPYSPFHEDVAHPTFLERANCAIAASTSLNISSILQSNVPVLVEEINRTASLRGWVFQEVSFPGPVAHVALRNEFVWLSTRDLATLPVTESNAGQLDNLRQHLYKTTSNQLKNLPFNFQQTAWPGERILTIDDLNNVFTLGEPTLGLLPAERSVQAVPVKVFVEEPGDGYERYASDAWSLEFEGESITMLHNTVVAAATDLLKKELKVGQPRWDGNHWLLPVRFRLEDYEFGLAVLQIDAVEADSTPISVFQKTDDNQYDLLPTRATAPILSGEVQWQGEDLQAPSMDSMYFNKGYWYLAADEDFFWNWIQWRPGEPYTVVSQQHFVFSYAGDKANGWFQRDIDALDADAVHFGDFAMVWHEQDSVYLFDQQQKTLKLIFHPANIGLEITPVGPGLLLFWMQNATKGYLFDINRQRSSADTLKLDCSA